MDWIDVSIPVHDGMIVFDGDPEVRVERVIAIAGGDGANVSRIELGTHTGTHVDPPLHFIDEGAGAELLPLDVLIGPAVVADARGAPGDIDAAALAALDVPAGTERLLLRTRNEGLWERPFTRDFVGVAEDAAHELLRMGVRLVGIDYLSIAPSGQPAPTHTALLGAGVVVVEGLDLREAPPGRYELVCLPLKIAGGDGAPARALLRPAEMQSRTGEPVRGRRSRTMDRTSGSRLTRLEPFVGEWRIEAPAFPFPPELAGAARATFEWTLGGAFLLQRSSVPVPEAPDGLSVIGPDGGDGYTQHYFDSRGIARVYAMTFDGGDWTLERHAPDFSPLPFHQRWVSRLSADGDTINGRWEKSPDGRDWELDFELVYRRVG